MGDLISRQAAIDIFDDYNVSVENGELEAYSRDRKRLCELPSAQPEPQWIPCSERLPDKKDDYLCSYNGCAVVDICEYDPDRNEWGFFYDGGWKEVSNVIAWMPLPEPYKER